MIQAWPLEARHESTEPIFLRTYYGLHSCYLEVRIGSLWGVIL
jgi:hypothetical protein